VRVRLCGCVSVFSFSFCFNCLNQGCVIWRICIIRRIEFNTCILSYWTNRAVLYDCKICLLFFSFLDNNCLPFCAISTPTTVIQWASNAVYNIWITCIGKDLETFWVILGRIGSNLGQRPALPNCLKIPSYYMRISYFTRIWLFAYLIIRVSCISHILPYWTSQMTVWHIPGLNSYYATSAIQFTKCAHSIL